MVRVGRMVGLARMVGVVMVVGVVWVVGMVAGEETLEQTEACPSSQCRSRLQERMTTSILASLNLLLCK